MYTPDLADELKYTFPDELPITAEIPRIIELIRRNPVVVVCGSTGSGKTTQLPKAALSAGFGRTARIGCTQPRRIAASSLAARVAGELSCDLGKQVGYKVRFDDKTSESTVVKFMTDGILLAETRDDRMLRQYDCLILDEIHERSLNIDFLMGFLKLLLKRRTDLHVVISSATLDTERISRFFDGAPIVTAEGKIFPVEDVWLPPGEEEELPEHVARAVEFLTEYDRSGDILVFLPGEREIRDCTDMLTGRRYPGTEILPLFGRLTAGEQQRVFHPGGRRRIILSTNVAETSLTIPGIRYVIDSGLVRLSRYNPRTRIQELQVETISQASAGQRRGRCGRLRDGVCVHLYSEEDLAKEAEFTPPEIQRSSLAGVILQMAMLKLPPLGKFPLVDEPASALVREGLRTLADISALDPKTNRLTRLGYQLAALPMDPHLGKMLIEGNRHSVLSEMIVISAFLSIQDPRERPFEKTAEADAAHKQYQDSGSDFIAILKLWKAVFGEKQSRQNLRRYAARNYLNYRRLQEWSNLVDDLFELCVEAGYEPLMNIDPDTCLRDNVHLAVLSGLPRQIGTYQPEEQQYMDMTGKKFLIFPGSGLAKNKKKPQWILSFALVETSRVFARCCAEVQPGWLEIVAPHLCSKIYESPNWDPESGFVYVKEKVIAGNLLIHPGRRKLYSAVDPVKAREIFIQQGLATGEATLRHTWLENNSRLITKLREMELRLRRPDCLLDGEELVRWYLEKLPPEISSVDAVKKRWIADKTDFCPPEERIIRSAYADVPETDYPDSVVSAGQRFRVNYVFDPGGENDGVTVFIPETLLNAVNPYLLEYNVPGYLGHIVDEMFRSLPKRFRVAIMPIAETVELFMQSYRDGEIFSEQPLADALADFLNENYETELKASDFGDPDFPEYMRMKLAILNPQGKIRSVERIFPKNIRRTSRLSVNIPAVRKLELTGSRAWPDIAERMPETVVVSKESGTVGYPALVPEENAVGRKIFLKEFEARNHHRTAVLLLHRIQNPALFSGLEKFIRVPRNLELSFFLEYRTWEKDLIDSAVLESLGCDSWDIRSVHEFDAAVLHSRDNAAEVVERYTEILQKTYEIYERLSSLRRKIQSGSFTDSDVKIQLELLFRKGFLRTPELFPEYPRYLKGLETRLSRAVSSPSKDEGKAADLKAYTGKLKLALSVTPELETKPELLEFFRLYLEAQINRFSPEIKTRFKCGAELLSETWEKVIV